MNGNEYILAFADIQDDLIHAASDDTAVRKVFRQYKSRRNKMISALCCCIVIAMVAVGFGSQKWFGKTPAVISNDTATADHLPTEPNETQPPVTQPGVIPQETESLSSATTQSPHETPSDTPEQPAPTAQTPSVGNIEPSSESAPGTAKTDVIWSSGTDNSSIVFWSGKQISYALWEVLQQNSPDCLIGIEMRPRVNDSFVYNGKPLREYEADALRERQLPDKLYELLKLGNMLKYGSEIYTDGTPDGEKWSKEYYDEQVAYFGEDMLSRYIVGNEFLEERVRDDIETAKNDTSAQDAYTAARQTAIQHALDEGEQALMDQQISFGRSGDALHFVCSARNFENLTPPSYGEWYFTLAQG